MGYVKASLVFGGGQHGKETSSSPCIQGAHSDLLISTQSTNKVVFNKQDNYLDFPGSIVICILFRCHCKVQCIPVVCEKHATLAYLRGSSPSLEANSPQQGGCCFGLHCPCWVARLCMCWLCAQGPGMPFHIHCYPSQVIVAMWCL